MSRIALPRMVLAVIGALHFVAAPCVMALSVAAPEEPCEHCVPGTDVMPCLTTAATPASSDIAPVPDQPGAPGAPVSLLALLPPPAAAVAGAGHGALATAPGLATGRHSGDPPLRILFQAFLI